MDAEEHARYQEEVAPFVEGRLEAERSAELSRHAAGCAECAEMIESWRLLEGAFREGGQELLAPHPSPRELRAHVLTRLEESSETDATSSLGRSGDVERHLRLCAACALETDILKRRYWPQPETAPPATIRPRRSAWLQVAAGAAAGLLCGIVISEMLLTPARHRPLPATAALQPGSGSGTPAPGEVHTLVLTDVRRGEDGVPSLAPADGQRSLLIGFAAPLPGAAEKGRRFLFEILSAQGTPVWRNTLEGSWVGSQLANPGIVFLDAPRESLAPGSYTLRVSDAGVGQSPLYLLPFSIAR